MILKNVIYNGLNSDVLENATFCKQKDKMNVRFLVYFYIITGQSVIIFDNHDVIADVAIES